MKELRRALRAKSVARHGHALDPMPPERRAHPASMASSASSGDKCGRLPISITDE
jgi:hypothetical protein